MCHGVYIDIHPIDNWMIEDKESYDRINALNKENSTYMRLTNPLLDDANKERCRHWSKRNPIDVYEEIQSIAKQYNNRETGYKIRAVITFMSYESMVMRSEWYNGFRLCDFEGFQFPVPFEAEKMLCVRYGDWQKPPSNSEKGCWHHYIFDADVPYPIFMEKYRNEQIATIDR
jgi:lipopolysaccharide cholinephosphotransferase